MRVIKGKVLDVAVDIRKKSQTYGQYFSVELSEENKYAPSPFTNSNFLSPYVGIKYDWMLQYAEFSVVKGF